MKASELIAKIQELAELQDEDVEVSVLSTRTGDVHAIREVWWGDSGIEVEAGSL